MLVKIINHNVSTFKLHPQLWWNCNPICHIWHSTLLSFLGSVSLKDIWHLRSCHPPVDWCLGWRELSSPSHYPLLEGSRHGCWHYHAAKPICVEPNSHCLLSASTSVRKQSAFKSMTQQGFWEKHQSLVNKSKGKFVLPFSNRVLWDSYCLAWFECYFLILPRLAQS